MALREANQRQRHLSRVSDALSVGKWLTERIDALEKQIAPMQERLDEKTRSIDFDAAANQLEIGMNACFNEINLLRKKAWQQRLVNIDISRSRFQIRIGGRRWSAVPGGTDTLYFLIAYQYGLLTLSNNPA